MRNIENNGFHDASDLFADGEKARRKQQADMDGKVIVEMSPDRMEAFIVVSQAIGEGKVVSFEEAMMALKEQWITKGIDYSVIEEAIRNPRNDLKRLCARGEPPVHGEDACVEYFFKTEIKTCPCLLENGKVDFKNLDLIENVEGGDVLAVKMEATPGIPGRDLHGQPIPATQGKSVRFIAGRGTEIIEEGMKIRAVKNGKVFLENGAIFVEEVYQVQGNVGQETGNIKFYGRVVVKGDVQTGFAIDATGDIEVYGIVEAAFLKSHGNILVGRGIMGNRQAYISCDGSLVSRYIQQANIYAGNGVEADAIIHSQIRTGGHVIAKGGKGIICGGVIIAGGYIKAKTIGSSMGTRTQAEVGCHPLLKEVYDGIQKLIRLNQGKLEELRMRSQGIKKQQDRGPLSQMKQEMLYRAKKAVVQLEKEQQELLVKCKKAEEALHLSGLEGKISAYATLHPDVSMSIRDVRRVFYEKIVSSSFEYKEGEIRIFPLGWTNDEIKQG